MCIIIDTNTLGPVFNVENAHHLNFKPVYNWIFLGPGKVVYGGTKYLEEIAKYRKLFKILKDIGKAVSIDTAKVDHHTTITSKAIIDKDFDDQHLVGLLLASKCRLICSDDKRAYPFFTHSLFFTARKKPKIYRNLSGAGILQIRYFADVCLPCKTSTNYQKSVMEVSFP